ncbi:MULTISPECIES: NADPH:quinone reductase [unclassified Tatumella]|uniref:NADPH:quinone reductase n=1 Tax=unclassified Tatumella TaxID=2649542 RepID=UPI001BAEE09E|nr:MULTISPECIES: NADPH:quinone reductase [unclassified Tatumella]MBS0855558.1 NADPH:quinone reductase [Tatumella sp. JGM16]MBS0893344.1 NADPH:quinone reductase [Tatumella sp. JGM130]MBS0912335.1 NADPH:quinone reductase [Tatumella sp. JGM91]
MPKRIQYSRHGGPEVLEWTDFTLPAPGDYDVVVENKAIGINYIDTYFRSGLYPSPCLPAGLGTEAAGVVLRTGRAVSRVSAGDRVVYAQSAAGAYSEQHIVHQDRLVILPDSISYQQAAASFLKGLTVQYLLRQTYPVTAGETLLFHAAAGGVGLIACQWAKALGAKLIGTVGSAEKAQAAKQAGAVATINYRQEDIAARVLALTGGQKVPVVYDSVGNDSWEASLDCLQRRGLMVSFGNSSGPVTGVNLGILNQKGSLFVTRPSLSGYITTASELDAASHELFTLLASGAIKVPVAESQKFALKEAALAHRQLESRATQGSSLLIP